MSASTPCRLARASMSGSSPVASAAAARNLAVLASVSRRSLARRPAKPGTSRIGRSALPPPTSRGLRQRTKSFSLPSPASLAARCTTTSLPSAGGWSSRLKSTLDCVMLFGFIQAVGPPCRPIWPIGSNRHNACCHRCTASTIGFGLSSAAARQRSRMLFSRNEPDGASARVSIVQSEPRYFALSPRSRATAATDSPPLASASRSASVAAK